MFMHDEVEVGSWRRSRAVQSASSMVKPRSDVRHRVTAFCAVFALFLTGLVFVMPSPAVDAGTIPASSTLTTIEAGAYIIDVGVQPQTYDNALLAYGLVYSLMIEHLIPVEWIVNDGKTGDGTQASDDPDFVYNGKEYKGGPFVIRAEYAADAAPILAQWGGPSGLVQADNVNGQLAVGDSGVTIDGPTTANIQVPVFATLTEWPNAVLDVQNGSIAQGYYAASLIPQVTTAAATGKPKVAYEFKQPDLLDTCDDIYVMPHADPYWSNNPTDGDDHANLLPFNEQGGFIWAACHAVSVLENVSDPADPNPDPELNFLSTEGLIDFGEHNDGSPPYSYTTDVTDPIMQFVGTTTGAQLTGSEQIYLPSPGSAWNPGTNVLVWDPDQVDLAGVPGGNEPPKPVSDGEAAAIIYGRGFDDPTNGLVMYEAGHTHNTGGPDAVAAIRAFFNLHLLAGIERGLDVETTVPDVIVGNTTVEVSATIEGGNPSYTYEWVSNCGGTFTTLDDQPFDEATINEPGTVTNKFIAPPDAQGCVLRLAVTDNCGRSSFDASGTEIVEVAEMSITKTDGLTSVLNGETLTYTITVTNGGPGIATNVAVVDTWPSTYLTHVSSTPSQGSCTFGGTSIICAFGSILVGGSATITVVATVKSTAIGVIVNTATVTALQQDNNQADNTATDLTTISGLRMEKTANPAFIDARAGAVPVTFDFAVSNVGPDPLNTVTISDADVPGCLPAYVSGDDDPADNILQVGEVWLFSCVASIDNDIINVATASALTPIGDLVTATDEAEVVAIAPDITIDKSVLATEQSDGGDVVFEIVVTNSGDTVLLDVAVSDPLEPSCDRYLGAMSPGDVISYYCSISPSPAAPATDTNIANVTSTDPGGTPVNDTDDAIYSVVDRHLDITKTAIDCATDAVLVDPAYYPSNQVCYLITVNNSGSTTQTNVELTDVLPTGVIHDTTHVIAPVTLIEDGFDHDVNDDAIYQQGFTEYNDNGQANDGNVEMSTANCPSGTGQCAYLDSDGVDDIGLQWETDLSGESTVDISFDYNVFKNDGLDEGFKVACWDGAAWLTLQAYDDLPLAAGSVSLVSQVLPTACQIAGGAIGIVTVAPTEKFRITIDNLLITTSSDSVADDFENYLSIRYYSEGITPGWAEYNETTSRYANDVRARNEDTWNSGCATLGDCAVQITNSDNGLVWPADYSLFLECTVEFDYRVFDTDGNASERIGIGGIGSTGTWVDAATIPLPLSAISATYLPYSLTIDPVSYPSLFTSASRLGVRSGPNNNGGEDFAIDNFKIGCISEWDTTSHPVIIDPSESIDLGPGAEITAKVTATMTTAGAAFPRELVNLAGISSDQEPIASVATATVERVISDINLDKTVTPAVTDPDTPVTYTFTVTNPGNEPLENVAILDPDVPGCVPTLDSGDLNGNTWLDPGEIWVFSCSLSVAASFTNVASVIGDPTTPGTGEAVPVIAGDSADVDVVDSGIQVVKSADRTIIRPNTPVTYGYDVTLEPGTTEPLSAVSVSDDKCSPVVGPVSGDDGDNVLEPGEVWAYNCSTTLAVTTTNVVTAEGSDRIDITRSDTDTLTVTVINPAIQVVKSASTNDIVPGTPVTYTFDVTNPGDDPLTSITIVDNRCAPLSPLPPLPGAGDDGDGVLQPGETWTYICSATVTADLTNVVEVSGVDSLGRVWTASDSVFVNVLDNSLAVGKVADASLVFPGDPVTYTIVAFNDGDTNFDSVTVIDPDCSPITGPTGDGGVIGVLEPGEGWFYTCTTNLDTTTTNTAMVNAAGPNGSASDSDSVRVRVHNPLINLTKVASETFVEPGTVVDYVFTAENVSVCPIGDAVCETDHEIYNLTLIDDHCTVEHVDIDLDGFNDGDIGADGRMSIGETWLFTCSEPVLLTTTNTVIARGTDPGGVPVPLFPAIAQVTVEASTAELEVTKTDALNVTGDTADYTIIVHNAGTGTVLDISVSDSLADADASLVCTPVEPFTLAPGATANCTASHTVTAAEIAAGQIVNTATATGQNAIGSPVTDLSDDPDDLTDVDTEGDGEPDDPTVTPIASIGDFVWLDLDNDGVQDPGEPGFEGATVILRDAGGSIVNTTTTDGFGAYAFVIAPGDYSIEIVGVSSTFSAQDVGGDDTVDSDVDGSGSTGLITVVQGANGDLGDAGITPASIGDFIWRDGDGDGVQDAGELGIPDVTVNLYDQNGVFITTLVTGPAGEYSFDGLVPGSQYTVEVISPDGVFSPTDQGDDAVDSDVDPAGSVTVIATSTSGAISADAGILPVPVAVDDFDLDNAVGTAVTLDPLLNDPGALDPTTVQLIDPVTLTSATTVVVADQGTWTVDPLTGAVTFSPEAGYTGDPDPIDYTVDDTSGAQVSATITVDYLQLPALTVDKTSDMSTYDELGDVITYTYQITNSGNSTLFGPFTVDDDILGALTNCASGPLAPAAVVTCAATHTVDAADLDAGSITNVASATDTNTGTTSPTDTVTVNVVLSEVNGVVYEDDNGNGVQDPGEDGIGGVDIVITSVTGATQTVTTLADGSYTAAVPAGTTTVDIVDATLPAGYIQTEGTDPTIVVVPAGGSASNVDGFVPSYVRLQVRVLLQGALNVIPDTYEFTTVMRDDLRVRGLIPTTEPYSTLSGFTHANGGGGETIAAPATVLADFGDDSIVDWVIVQLRDAGDFGALVATRSALVQRDGDVVDVDGVSMLEFASTVPGAYFVSVNHRNHLGAMTATAISLSATGTLVDFADVATPLWDQPVGPNYDGVEQFELFDAGGAPTGLQALWAGDVHRYDAATAMPSESSAVNFAGENNDVDPVFNEVDGAPGNAFFRSKAYIYVGYHSGDVNMNGETIFAGENNDVDLIYNNVDQHPLNAFFHNKNFLILEQVPR